MFIIGPIEPPETQSSPNPLLSFRRIGEGKKKKNSAQLPVQPYLFSASLNPLLCILMGDATADLQRAGPRR